MGGIILPEGLEINEWWALEPGENFWLEITGRPDIGADLKAPQFAEDGISETYSYSLLKHVKDGDVVFHYANRNVVFNKHKSTPNTGYHYTTKHLCLPQCLNQLN